MSDIDLDLGNNIPAALEVTQATAAEDKEGDGEADGPAPADGIKKTAKIKYDPAGEPFVAGQCAVTLALTIQPDDGHAEGRLVVIGAKSHNEAPIFASARLNALALPPVLADLLEQYEASLPERGAKADAAKAKAEAKKKAEAEKKAQAEAERKAKSAEKAAKTKAANAKKAAPKPEKVEKPKTPAQIEAEQKAAARAELLAQAKAEAAQAAMF